MEKINIELLKTKLKKYKTESNSNNIFFNFEDFNSNTNTFTCKYGQSQYIFDEWKLKYDIDFNFIDELEEQLIENIVEFIFIKFNISDNTKKILSFENIVIKSNKKFVNHQTFCPNIVVIIECRYALCYI